MAPLSLKSRISIAEICFYAPSLILALALTARHGPGRNTAWLYLIIFSCIRLTGAALQLETLQQPLSIPINTAAMILQNVGISPLMLVTLSLLGRLLARVRSQRKTLLKPLMLRFVQLLVILGLVLGIAGGVKAGNEFSRTWRFQMQIEGKAGLGLICAGYILLLLATVVMSFYAAHIVAGEKRLLLAVSLSLPFILVRIVYGCLATFTTDIRFNQLVGDETYFLGMAVVMEMAVVVVCASIGLTLPATPWTGQKEAFRQLAVIRILRGHAMAVQASEENQDKEIVTDTC